MADRTKIEWVDHTWNPWIGCTRISFACDHCYAATLAGRYGWAKWGAGEPRHHTSASTWQQPRRWNARAAKLGVTESVFPSLCDPFDAEVSDEWRGELMGQIEATPHLNWRLLTKRPKVARQWFDGRRVPPNVWLGITAENQAMLKLRAPDILAIKAALHFISYEPALGPLQLNGIEDRDGTVIDTLAGTRWLPGCGSISSRTIRMPAKFGWIIAGGESGPYARPSDPDWFYDVRDQCGAYGVPFFFKQWGEWAPEGHKPDHEATYEADFAAGRTWRFPGQPMRRVGKQAAGAMLDGREWREVPT